MKITQEQQNQVIGELLTMEKYKFSPINLIGEVARDIFKELNKL